jgi:hypothetical protein
LIPSLYISGDKTQAWSVTRAAAYGAVIGVVAALFKMFGPWREPHSLAAFAREFVVAGLVFALLCGGAALLRNFVARRLI